MDQTDLLDEVEQLLRELEEVQRLLKQWSDEYLSIYRLEEGEPLPAYFATPEAAERWRELDERQQKALQRLRDLRERMGKTDRSGIPRRQLEELYLKRIEEAAIAGDAILLRQLQKELTMVKFFLDEAASSAESSTTVHASVAALEKRVQDLARSLPDEFNTQLSEIRSDLHMLAQITRAQVTDLESKAKRMSELLQGATDIVAILDAKSHESRISSLETRIAVLSREAATQKGLVEAVKSNWIALLALLFAGGLLILNVLDKLGYLAP